MALDTPIQSMGNTIVRYNGVDITAALQSSSLAATIEELETTNLASTAVETRPSPSKWTITFNGYWSKELDDALSDDIINPPADGAPVDITFGKTPNAVKYAWTGKCYITGWTIGGGAPADYIPHDGSLVMSGSPARTTV